MTSHRDAATVAEGQTAVDEEAVVSLSNTAETGERYVALGEIGRGGMGEITLCLDRRIGRRVALKRSQTGANLQRFVREACIQGQLEHPTVVPLYDMIGAGADASFTMKRVRGRTLRDILNALAAGDRATADRFTQRKLLTDFAGVCLGVAFAHDRGVVHRDLKPDNLMSGDYGEVYVLDWGVAKIADAADEPVEISSDAGVTAAGSMIGTAGYMSPEQCRGETEKLDARSDVYSLGAILFETLTLRRLHTGAFGARVESTLKGANAHAPDAPPELEAICIRATEMDREDRFASARDLHDAVERYLNHDRDLELRRTLSARHAQEAASTTDRKRALAEAGRALALDPTNPDAQRLVVRLLTEPPERIPDEAREKLEVAFHDQRRETARTGFPAMLLLASAAGPLLAMGVREWAAFGGFISAIAVMFGLVWVTSRMERPGHPMTLAIALVMATTNLLAALIFGPLIVTPSLAMLSTAAMINIVDRHRVLIVALGIAPIVLPLVAAHFGLLPSSYTFHDGQMHVLPLMVGLPANWSITLLLAMNLTCVLASAHTVARMRRHRVDAETKLIVQAWQLRHLAPDATSLE